jgi:serine/threonine protein kinase
MCHKISEKCHKNHNLTHKNQLGSLVQTVFIKNLCFDLSSKSSNIFFLENFCFKNSRMFSGKIVVKHNDGHKLPEIQYTPKTMENNVTITYLPIFFYLHPQPERIDPKKPEYDIRADVWSLGITLVELATGVFPYKGCKTDFEVLTRVLESDPPSLPSDQGFSQDFQKFVHKCLTKDHRFRPKYKELLEQPYITYYENAPIDVAEWFQNVANKTGITITTNQPATTTQQPMLPQSQQQQQLR